MEKKEFKKVLQSVLEKYEFKYYSKEKTYYCFKEGLIAAVDTQKSNFGDYYYLNYGFRIDNPDNTTKFPKVYNGCDVMLRFVLNFPEGPKAEIDLNTLDTEAFSGLIDLFIEKEIQPVISKGISELLIINPDAAKCFTLRGKKLLGLA